MKKYRVILLFILPLLFLTALYYLNYKNSLSDFNTVIQKCGLEKENLRFSCYRNAIEVYFGKDVNKFSKWIHKKPIIDYESGSKGDNITYAIFGTNCHTFFHAAGDFIATHSKDSNIKNLRSLGTQTCTDGYIMGLYKRLALRNNFSKEYLVNLYNSCPENELFWCAHEMGHLLYDKYTYSILKVVDSISKEKFNLSYSQNYQYSTVYSLNVDDAFLDCEKMFSDSKRISQCWSGIGHDIFLFTEFSGNTYISAKKECAHILHKNECFMSFVYRVGLNKVAPYFLSYRFNEGNKACQTIAEGDEILKLSCYKGLGRGIGLFFNSQYSNQIIAQETNQLAQEIKESEQLCDKAEKKYISECKKEFLETRLIKKLRKSWELH